MRKLLLAGSVCIISIFSHAQTSDIEIKKYDMKKHLFTSVFFLFSIFSFSQGKSISLAKKSIEPVVINETLLKVGDVIYFQLGKNPDGSFQYVQDLNNFNEPLRPATSRTAMMKQPIKFFKEKDGVVYAFTKYFVVNLSAALLSGETKIISEEKK